METATVIEVIPRPSVEFCCARCGLQVEVCRSCWRNQKYCSKECSAITKLERHRRNQKVYRLTPAGQENHKAHQRTYREQKKIRE